MGGEGIEPSRPYGHQILSLARLPIPPLAQTSIILSHYVIIDHMDNSTGGQSSLSPAERGRQTAAEIARKKVLSAYARSHNFRRPNPQVRPIRVQVQTPVSAQSSIPTQISTPAQVSTQTTTQAPAQAPTESSYKQTPISAATAAQDWQKYHSAWQGYYQKYYSEYYAKAARQYLETEKMKQARQKNDDARLEGTHIEANNDPAQISSTLKERIQERATKNLKLSRRYRHLVPILAGVFVVLFILFLQYNRMIFAPIMAYIAPGNTTDTGITAIDPTVTEAPGPDPRLIIPKINVDVPVAFGISNDEKTVMDAMNHGVAQFSIPGASAMPGQVGNLVITGHSAGDIYSNNQYKFIFSGLERLVDGDNIYINYQSVRYTYSVIKKETVEPSNLAALVYETSRPMLTLITCTPLGTSRYRLLVTAEQVNPSPDTAGAAVDTSQTITDETAMPANEPSFFESIWNWATGN